MKGICKRCNQDIGKVPSCVTQISECDKQKHPPIFYGSEEEGWITIGRLPLPKCHDCGVEVKRPHHKGCSEEVCAHCHHKAATCGCSMRVVETK